MKSEGRKGRRRWTLLLAALLLLAAGFALWRGWQVGRRINVDALKKIPLLQQGDYDRPVAVFSGEAKSVATSGCGAVCMAMAIGYLTGTEVSAEDLFAWAYDNKYYFGDGLGHEALTAMAQARGLKSEWVANDRLDSVRSALESGYPVVAHVGPGTFTRNGHYILLRGLDEEGNALVNDPQSIPLSQGAYPLEMIQSELRRENCLMIMKP